MITRSRLPLSILTSLVLLFSSVPSGLACGPFSLDAIFVFTVHPEYPLTNFARGDLGVIQSSYARSYLVAAYRNLSGIAFNQGEQETVVELWKDRLDFRGGPDDQEWIQQWNAARAKVSGVGSAPTVDVYRHRQKPNEYETYLNCQKDAFQSAAATLAARINKYGSDSSVVKQWVGAQDQVFANCSEGVHIPEPLTDGDGMSKADRNYQIAAAQFYSENFPSARHLFEEILHDTESPWHEIAPYLIARTFVREASLGVADTRQTNLTQAEQHLNGILSDPKLGSLHTPASRLLSVVTLRLRPEQRLHELAELLARKDRIENLKQDLWDYTFLLDQFLGDSEKPVAPKSILTDDLSDWIITFQTNSPEALAHAVSKWQETHATRWLISALSKINVTHPQVPDLLADANKIGSDSPAYPTAIFHILRLALEAGRTADARDLLDRVLTVNKSVFNASARNQLLNIRMALALNLNEFLTYSQRLPAGFSWNDDGREIPTDLKDEEESNKSLQGQVLFDSDAAQILNQALPLSVLKQAAVSKALPAHLRRDLVQATWLRSVLLNDYQTAQELVPSLKALVPDASTLLDEFLKSQSDNKRFSALYLWLKFPGFEPVVDTGVGRRTPLGEQDIYRDNWWCGAALSPDAVSTPGNEKEKSAPLLSLDPKQFPTFESQAERSAAAREHAALLAIGAAPNYLCRGAIAWGTKNPDDPRVPEALHLAIKATRYGCTDKETGRWSKAAFDLLHKRYADSVWAKRTPYWFKD